MFKVLFIGGFPINSGEGGVTSNFFVTHENYDSKYMTIVDSSSLNKSIKKSCKILLMELSLLMFIEN